MLWKSMTSDMRFLKQREAGDASSRKLMPVCGPDGMKAHFVDETLEQSAQRFGVRNRGLIAVMRFDDPLAA